MANTYPVDNGYLKENLSTGFISGLQLSINSGDNTKVDIAAGIYVITDYTNPEIPRPRVIHFEGVTGITPQYLTTDVATYIALDIDGNVIQMSTRFSDEDRRDYCTIGAAIHSNLTTVNLVNQLKAPIVGDTEQLHDLMRVIGSINVDGNLYGNLGTNLQIFKTAGTIFKLGVDPNDIKSPHTLFLSPESPVNFRYRLRDSTEYADTLTVDPNNYDLNGVLTPVDNNKFTIQHINLFQSNSTRFQYGQRVYEKFSDALVNIGAEGFVTEQNISDNAIFRCYLVMKQGITDLQFAIDNDQARFVLTDKFGSVIGGAGVALTFTAIVNALGYTPLDAADIIPTNTNTSLHTIATIGGIDIKETVTQLNPLELQGNILYVKFRNENDVEQVVNIDLSNLNLTETGITNATYNASQNIITLTEADGDVWTINLSEFSIIVNTDVNGVTTLTQEGVIKATLSKVGQTGQYADLLNKPTTLAGFGLLTEADSRYLQSYTETDPVFNASVASDITQTDIDTWNGNDTIPKDITIHKSQLTTLDEAGVKEYLEANNIQKLKNEYLLISVDERDTSGSIVTPTDGNYLTPTTTFTLITDIAGVPDRVELYEDGIKIDEKFADPYNFDWVVQTGITALSLKLFIAGVEVFSSAGISIEGNYQPTAADDSYTVEENQVLTVAAPGLIGSVTDPEGDTILTYKNTDPANGTVTVNTDGSFTYTPNAEFFGTDSFEYYAVDNKVANQEDYAGVTTENSATVTITVTESTGFAAPYVADYKTRVNADYGYLESTEQELIDDLDNN